MTADDYVNLILITLLIIIAIQYIYNLIKHRNGINIIPGLEKSNPRYGNLLEIKKHGSLHQFLDNLHANYGDIASFYWNSTKVVSICSHELFKSVQNMFDRPSLIFGNFSDFIGENNLQYANGYEGQTRRKQYDKAFHHEMLTRYILAIANVGKDNLKTFQIQNSTVKSIDHMCFKMAVKSILKICIIPVEKNSEFYENIIELYKKIFYGLEKRLVDGKIYSENDDEEIEFQKNKANFYSIITEIVNMRLEYLENIDYKHEDLMLIDFIILFHREMNRNLIENEVMSYTIGGFHTTGNALAWCIFYLAKHPECQEKLYDEIIKRKMTFSDTSECYKRISDMKYLKACIDETLRLSQLAPYAARISDEDRFLLQYKIPANTPIILALGVSFQNEKIFHKYDQFIPERFIRDDFPSFAFEPFGFAGKRKCPGERFSYLELSIWMVQFVEKYRFALTDKNQKVKKVYGLVTHMNEDVSIDFTER